MLVELESYWKKYPFLSLLFIIGIIGFLGLTDFLTGEEMSFSIFYLIPITLITVMAGRRMGLFISILCSIVWLVADLTAGHTYSKPLIPYWNAFVRLGYFFIHTLIFSSLLELLRQEKDRSLHDPLTGAANWRFFKEYAHRELKRNLREGKSLTVAYFDLDDFKLVNDKLGHDAGNELLQVISGTIQSFLRSSDMLARVGGDEFVIFLPDTDYRGAATVLTRIHSAALAQMKRYKWPVTLSIGAITYNVLPSSIEPMIKRVDELMYAVKASGKNNLRHDSWPPENFQESQRS